MEYGVTTLKKYVSPQAVTLMQQLGITWVRLQCKNQSVETSPGVYDWTQMDPQVNAMLNGGFNVILTLEGFASWWLDPVTGTPTAAGMISWGSQIITRYGTQIRGVEMGNEEYAFVSNSNRDASVYYAVVSQAYPVLSRLVFNDLHLFSSFTLGMFGYTNYSTTPGTNGDPAFWFNRFCQLGGMQFVDYANVHLYNGGVSPLQTGANGTPGFMDIVRIINNAQANVNYYPLKPIRITEFGWQGRPGGSNFIGPAQQSIYVRQAIDLVRSDPAAINVSHMFLYTCDAVDAGFTDIHDIAYLSSYGSIRDHILNARSGVRSMPFDAFLNPDGFIITGPLTIKTDVRTGEVGKLSSDNGAVTSDGKGNFIMGTLSEAQTTGVVQTLVTGNTITVPANTGVVRVTAAAAVTGIILLAGATPGQNLTVIHEGAAANTITFAAAGTSNVADGVSDVITGPTCRSFVWDSITSLWYRAA